MDVNRLLSDELSYELRARNLPSEGTVANKRMMLRNALHMERSGSLPSYLPVNLDIESEIEICGRKLLDLARDIENFDEANRDNEFRRIYSRLVHVTTRLKRLPVNVEDVHRAMIAELYTRGFSLMEQLNEVYSRLNEVENLQPQKAGEASSHPALVHQEQRTILDSPNDPSSSVIDELNPLLPQVNPCLYNSQQPEIQASGNFVEDLIDLGQSAPRKVSFGIQTSSILPREDNSFQRSAVEPRNTRHAHNSTFGAQSFQFKAPHQSSPHSVISKSNSAPTTISAPSVVYVENPHHFVNVSSWNIHFNGESGSLFEFLTRVEEFRLSRGVSKDRLFKAAPELLRGTALNWFRSMNITSWDELVDKLKSSFLPFDYEYALNEEIRQRSQGPQEKVIVYISSMQNLLNRLSNKPDEPMRVALIRRNLLPYLQNALALQSVRTVEELTRLCRTIEETSLRAQQYTPPKTNHRYLLEPQLAYRTNDAATRVGAVNMIPAMTESKSVQMESKPEQSGRTQRKVTTCWNCDTPGHRFGDCKMPRQKFCYKCGHKGTIARECSKCQGNALMGYRRTGE